MRDVLSTRDGEYIRRILSHGNKKQDKKLKISNRSFHAPADTREDREKVGETDPRIRAWGATGMIVVTIYCVVPKLKACAGLHARMAERIRIVT
jgi:hypothetical protein